MSVNLVEKKFLLLAHTYFEFLYIYWCESVSPDWPPLFEWWIPLLAVSYMSLDYDGKRQRQWPSTSRMASECGPMRPHGHGLDQGPGQRSSSFELFMAPHLSTYRISCSTLTIFRRDAVVASAHRLSVFSTSARRDVLLSAIGRLLLPALDFGTVYLLVCLVTHNISSEAENSFISAILPRHCVITTSP